MSEEGGLGRRIITTLAGTIVSALGEKTWMGRALGPEVHVKLIHTRDLAAARRLPRYQDHAGISLTEFRIRRHALRSTQRECQDLVEARNFIAAKGTDDHISAGGINITIPKSLTRRDVSVPLPMQPCAGAVPHWHEGRIENDRLWAQGRWRERVARLDWTCASREMYAPELTAAAQRLAAASAAEQAALNALQTSPYRAPVLFISHRWHAAHHPDPDGHTLKRLQELGDAYLILDYCSFPQPPFAAGERERLNLILAGMGNLMRNVVVVHSDDYLHRGWCVYEYLCACLKGTLVCDEIQDPRYTDLFRWAFTEAPPRASVFRDGISALKANFIQESILSCINQLLPQFKASQYTLASDKDRVTRMLRDELLQTLPARRIHDPYLGETLSKPWTARELKQAFAKELLWSEMDTSPTPQFDVSVPASLAEGREHRFRTSVERSAEWKSMRAFSDLRDWYPPGGGTDHGPDLGAVDA